MQKYQIAICIYMVIYLSILLVSLLSFLIYFTISKDPISQFKRAYKNYK